MKKNLFVLLSLLLLASMLLSACGDIGPSPMSYPTMAITIDSAGKKSSHTLLSRGEWNKLRWDTLFDPSNHASGW